MNDCLIICYIENLNIFSKKFIFGHQNYLTIKMHQPCEISAFSDNIEGLKFAMQRHIEEFSSRIQTRGQKFTELDSAEYKSFLQAFWREQGPKIENFFLEKFKNKAYTFDSEVFN